MLLSKVNLAQPENLPQIDTCLKQIKQRLYISRYISHHQQCVILHLIISPSLNIDSCWR